jgi:ligand-binding sensor domain-containing protein
MDRGTVVDYPIKPDSLIRNVKAFAEHAPRKIWAGSEGGLFFIDRDQFRFIGPAVVDSPKDVMGIVDTKGSGLWLNTTGGIIHVSRNELDRALRDPVLSIFVRAIRFLRWPSGTGRGHIPISEGDPRNGRRLWFTATRGVA